MADVTKDIRRAFETTLNAISGIPVIAWENVSIDPETDSPYIEPRLVPTIRRPAVRGPNPQMYYQGYYLVDVYAPKDKGPDEADTIASTIIDTFEATTDITYNSVEVSIRYAERDLGIKEGSFYKISVRLGYYTYN